MRDWSSDVCSSDLHGHWNIAPFHRGQAGAIHRAAIDQHLHAPGFGGVGAVVVHGGLVAADIPTIMPGTRRSSSLMSRAPLALINSLSSTVMLPGTAAGDCFRRVAVHTWGRGWLSTNKSSDSTGGLMNSANSSDEPERRSEEHTSELQSLMRSSYAVFCLKTKQKHQPTNK